METTNMGKDKGAAVCIGAVLAASTAGVIICGVSVVENTTVATGHVVEGSEEEIDAETLGLLAEADEDYAEGLAVDGDSLRKEDQG